MAAQEGGAATDLQQSTLERLQLEFEEKARGLSLDDAKAEEEAEAKAARAAMGIREDDDDEEVKAAAGDGVDGDAADEGDRRSKRSKRAPKQWVGVDDSSGASWSVWEDETLRNAVAKSGTRWDRIAAELPGRSAASCKERWGAAARGSVRRAKSSVRGGRR